MTYSPQWLRLCESAEVYGMRQYAVLQDKEQLALDLDKALTENSLSALALWSALDPGLEILIPLLSRVLSFAIDSTDLDKIRLAREILSQHKEAPELRSQIQLLIARYLPDNDDWNYRRIAELYTLLQYQEELAAFLVLCRASGNEHIKEIGDDYLPL